MPPPLPIRFHTVASFTEKNPSSTTPNEDTVIPQAEACGHASLRCGSFVSRNIRCVSVIQKSFKYRRRLVAFLTFKDPRLAQDDMEYRFAVDFNLLFSFDRKANVNMSFRA